MGQIYDHYMPDITVTAAGRDWKLKRASDFDSLWDEMVADGRADADEHIPYWTELWPSSIALCSWLSERRDEIAGRSCLDLGCGLGLTALAAASLGAHVTAVDYEFDTLHYARVNAAANGISPEPVWLAMDWRHPALREGSMERIWGGDIMYETRFVAPVLSLFSHCLAPGGKRSVPGFLKRPRLRRLCRKEGLQGQSRCPVHQDRARHRLCLGNHAQLSRRSAVRRLKGSWS